MHNYIQNSKENKSMKQIIKSLLEYLGLINLRYSLYKRDKMFIKRYSLSRLLKNEIKIIHETWPCFNFVEKDLIYAKLYKKEYGFDPYFICDYQLQLLLKKTNPLKQVEALQHKGLVDIWFPDLNFPEVYVRCIAGVLYDKKMNIITLDEAIELLINKESFIIKPTIDTGCGKGVNKIMTKTKTYDELINILSLYKKDFIVQETVKQSKEIEGLNPTSLNTCRVTSIFIDGKWGFSTIFKVGRKGSDKDNWNSSYLIGVTEKGYLKEFGYDNMLNKVYKTDLGQDFKGIRLPSFDAMISFTKEKHIKYFPHCGIIGWDVFIDNNDNIRVIEVNLDSPGVLGEQLASGTFFKEFRNDIVKLMNN